MDERRAALIFWFNRIKNRPATQQAYEIAKSINTAPTVDQNAKSILFGQDAKTPAMLDDDIRVFDSNAMLIYLAEKIGKFVPSNTPKNKAEMYSWLMFVATGIGPYCGQAVHFKHFAPEPKEYAVNRYDFEAWRHWHLINDHLANQPYMMGNEYTLVDMSVWGWARVAPFVLGADAWEKLPHVKRLLDEINARPAAQRAEALKTKFAFKTEMDEDARKKLFPSNERLKAAGA